MTIEWLKCPEDQVSEQIEGNDSMSYSHKSIAKKQKNQRVH